MEQQTEPKVPNCGFDRIKTSSHKPWNERSVHISTKHLLRHLKPASKAFLTLNRSFLLIFSVFVIVVLTFALLDQITWRDTFFVFSIMIALCLGAIVRLAKADIKIESLQVWFRDAYGLLVPFPEVVIALTNMYAGVNEYLLSNGGVLKKTPIGLIYEEPTR